MRQRNISGSTLTVPEIGVQAGPGEVVDHPELICGFEPVPDEPAPAPAEPAPTKTTRRAQAPAAQDEENSK